jgi:putative oxidoreductase
MAGFLDFNVTDPFVILRLVCGLFLVPHIYGKFFVPAALEFFIAAKFQPPAAWMYLAAIIETVLAIGLIFGIYTGIVGVIAFIHLMVAAAATYKVTGKWLWHIGGAEYCVFWALACLVVGLEAWGGGA